MWVNPYRKLRFFPYFFRIFLWKNLHFPKNPVGAGNGGRFGDIEVQPSTAEGAALYLNCLSALNQHFTFAFLSINWLHLCWCSGNQPRFWKVGNLQLGTKGSSQKPKRVFYGQPDHKHLWKFWAFFPIENDSLILKTDFVSLWRGWKMPFSGASWHLFLANSGN